MTGRIQSMKNLIKTPSVMELATCRLVAHCVFRSVTSSLSVLLAGFRTGVARLSLE